MTNRLASLFLLDDLMAASTRGRANASPGHSPPAPRQSVKAAKARRGHKTAKTDVHIADNGAPIRCEHDVAYPAVERVQLPLPVPTSPHTDSLVSARQLSSDEYDVEAFDDSSEYTNDEQTIASDDQSSLRLQANDDADTSLTIEEPEQTHEALGGASNALSRAYGALPPTFAAQMNAVEQDLATLADRARTAQSSQAQPTPNDPWADADDDSAVARPSKAASVPAGGHAIFDKMAQGMAYATEFRLPPVQLSQMFNALDQQLDADTQSPPTRTPPTANMPPVTTAPNTTAEHVELPSNETLIRDLVALPEPESPRTDADAAHPEPTPTA